MPFRVGLVTRRATQPGLAVAQARTQSEPSGFRVMVNFGWVGAGPGRLRTWTTRAGFGAGSLSDLQANLIHLETGPYP